MTFGRVRQWHLRVTITATDGDSNSIGLEYRPVTAGVAGSSPVYHPLTLMFY